MMRTEKEARQCWCPFARAAISDGTFAATANRAIEKTVEIEGCRCVASACMAWRWVDEVDEIHGTVATTKRIRGFCGLAGRP
jgi:hypothetical protein